MSLLPKAVPGCDPCPAQTPPGSRTLGIWHRQEVGINQQQGWGHKSSLTQTILGRVRSSHKEEEAEVAQFGLPAGTGSDLCSSHGCIRASSSLTDHQTRPPAKLQPHQPFITIIKKKKERITRILEPSVKEQEKWKKAFPGFFFQLSSTNRSSPSSTTR